MLSGMKLYNEINLDDSGLVRPQCTMPARVHAVCSCRVTGGSAGHSAGVYAGLNLGSHVGDAPVSVAANRATWQEMLGVRPVFMEQVHGIEALELVPDTSDGRVADVAWTSRPGLACTAMVADCLPVLFWDDSGTCVAAAHAGWRGLLGTRGMGVLEQAVHCLGRPATSISAWLGPCIGPDAFEVGEEVRQAFLETSPQAQACFRPRLAGSVAVPEKWLADLPALARQRLVALGLKHLYGNDGSQAWCTVSNPGRFYSHRRDGVTGRQAAAIWLSD